MKKTVALMSVVILGAFALVLAHARANPGAFDPTWGDGGLASVLFSENGDLTTAGRLDADGRVVVAGWVDGYPGAFGLARLRPDGSLDSTFGEGGKVMTRFGDDPELPNAPWSIGPRQDGGYLVAGEICDVDYVVCDWLSAAYTADGALDPTFGGGDGWITASVTGADGVYAWPPVNLLQTDGKMIVGGIVVQPGGDIDSALRRHNIDGSLDDTFGDGGVAVLDIDPDGDYLENLALLPDGKILLLVGTGEVIDPFTYIPNQSFLVRLNGDGSIDDTFGVDGKATWGEDGSGTGPEGLVVSADGTKIYVAGVAPGAPEGAGDCVVSRFDGDGNMDMTFGAGGRLMIDTGLDEVCISIDELPDGRLALSGVILPLAETRVASGRPQSRGASSRPAQAGETVDSLVARANADGTLDGTFGDGGRLAHDINEADNAGFLVFAQPNGRILVMGDMVDSETTTGAMAISRFLGDGLPQGATPGAFDPTWGQEGITTSDVTEGNDGVTAHVLLDDGRYVIAGWFNNFPGDFGVGRFLANGRPDLSFGDGGWVTTAFSDDPTLVEAAWAVGARPDGGLYVVGDVCDADYDYCDLGTAAYLPDGSLDESFSDDGLTTLVLESGPTYAWPGRVIVQPDGKVVIGGVAFLEEGGSDLVLARYHPDGTLDESFGDDGVSVTDLAGMGNFMQDLMALPGGKILAMGVFGDPIDPFNNELAAGFIARFNSDGTLDTDFGSEGGFTSWDNDGAGAAAQHAVLTPDDQLLIMGHFETAERSICNLQRFDLDGIQDMTFGEDGVVIIDVGQDDECWEMDLAPDGKVVLGGPSFPLEEEEEVSAAGSAANRLQRRLERRAPGLMSRQADSFYSFIVRYYLDGTPDDTFGDNGILRLNLFDNVESLINVVVQPDGKILTSGNNETDAVTTRFLGDGPAAQVLLPVIQGGAATGD